MGSLLAYEGDFGLTLGSLWADKGRMVLVMPIVSPCVRPKRVHEQEITIFAKDFACPKRVQGRQKHEQHSEPSDFWGTLGPRWGYFGVTLGSLLLYGVDFGSLWDHFGMIVESLWAS